MHGAILGYLAAMRHADLMREAQHARRVAAVRRNRTTPPAVWHRRVGGLLIRLRPLRRWEPSLIETTEGCAQ
jgi:hypothetical protein